MQAKIISIKVYRSSTGTGECCFPYYEAWKYCRYQMHVQFLHGENSTLPEPFLIGKNIWEPFPLCHSPDPNSNLMFLLNKFKKIFWMLHTWYYWYILKLCHRTATLPCFTILRKLRSSFCSISHSCRENYKLKSFLEYFYELFKIEFIFEGWNNRERKCYSWVENFSVHVTAFYHILLLLSSKFMILHSPTTSNQ